MGHASAIEPAAARGEVVQSLLRPALAFDAPLAATVAQLIEADSAEPWCAADLAAELGPGTAVNLVATLLRAGVVTRAEQSLAPSGRPRCRPRGHGDDR